MHYDELHPVTVTQTHRAIVESVSTYELDSDRYVEFMQLDEHDHGAREEFILDHATYVDESTEIVDITETTDVIVSE